MTTNRVSPITVLIVDDHKVIRQGLISLLKATDEIRVVGDASNAAEAIKKTKELKPDIVLLDIRLPGQSGIDVCRLLHHQFPKSRVIILTSYAEDDNLFQALQAGAWGFLLKTEGYETLVEAITTVAGGQKLLSPPFVEKLMTKFSELVMEITRTGSGFDQQEIDILKLVAKGLSNKDIAETLHWSEISIKRKLQTIFDKLEVQDRTSAAVEAIRRGLI
jgi:DNA-binding NarL/FixJ family response regulator